MSDRETRWQTAITEIKPNEIRLRGYRIDELMGRITFAQAIYLALTGALPSPEAGRLLDAILVSSIDHGATPPSTLAARTAASTGAPLNGAVAAGVLSINRHHGGAIEDCLGLLRRVIEVADGADGALDQAAAQIVAEARAAGAACRALDTACTPPTRARRGCSRWRTRPASQGRASAARAPWPRRSPRSPGGRCRST